MIFAKYSWNPIWPKRRNPFGVVGSIIFKRIYHFLFSPMWVFIFLYLLIVLLNMISLILDSSHNLKILSKCQFRSVVTVYLMYILFWYTDYVVSLLSCSCCFEGKTFSSRFIRDFGRSSTPDTAPRASRKGVSSSQWFVMLFISNCKLSRIKYIRASPLLFIF